MSRLFSGTPFDRPIVCEKCGKTVADCRCLNLPEKRKMSKPGGNPAHKLDSGLILTPKNSNAPPDQVARVRVEKRKGDRRVTVISGLDHPANDLPALCTELKQILGVGGSVQGRTIELQGQYAEAVVDHLIVEKGLNARKV